MDQETLVNAGITAAIALVAVGAAYRFGWGGFVTGEQKVLGVI